MAECSIEGCGGTALARGWCPKHYYRWRMHGDPAKETTYDITVAERFWRKVDKTGECWVWTAGRDRDGYGAFSIRGESIRAPRFAWTLEHGEIPAGMYVMHICDNPPCVNPTHLRLGTSSENSADASRKGRRLPGSKNHQAKLTEDQVREIRRLSADGATQKELAARFGVSHALVSFIVTRRAWKHI